MSQYHTNRIRSAELLATLPTEWPTSLLPEIQSRIQSSGQSIVVLDDDPTGTQTVYDVPVLTEWSVATLQAELARATPLFYVLTNSRSLPAAAASALNIEIAENLLAASQATERPFSVVSRSDSTLRGHYPGEVDALLSALGYSVDAQLIIPYFLEGGRLTINDVHYVAETIEDEAWLVPASETPFAQDAVFGYTNANLCAWVEEKTNGAVSASDVASITLTDIRQGGPEHVAQKLQGLNGGMVCIINAVTLRDLEVVVQGILDAEASSTRFIYRTAASFVQIRAGLAPRPLLTASDLGLSTDGSGPGGLVVVGSYVPKTTAQLNALLAEDIMTDLEVNVQLLLDDASQAEEITRVVTAADRALAAGEDVVVYTSRELVRRDDANENLQVGQRISDSLVEIVRRLQTQPRYLIAKGGITSSDTATKALGIQRAMVMGQIYPGIPLWQAGEESRFPGVPYVVFPGNVGGDGALDNTKILTT
ncbi:MAG: four-carbon acid sugar kinase family protein [Chloroflexota bacterium]